MTPGRFDRDGVRFQYPTNWTAETDPAEGGGWTVVVQSPRSAFVLVSLVPDAADPAAVADGAIAALREEYKELDAESAVETVAGRMAIGHDIDFLTLDTPVSCRTRALDTASGVLLVMTQIGEFDRAATDPVLAAVLASLTVETDD